MAGEDGAAPPPPPPPLPSYPEMIVEAIRALGHENGSNKTGISDYIKGRYGSGLPALHNAFLTGHLARMKATGELAFVRNNYLLPYVEEASPLRTDGHKDKDEDSAGVFDSNSFLLDFEDDELLAPPLVIDADADADDIAVPAPAPVTTADVNPVPVPVPTKRGRGRPPKPKDPVAVGSSSGETATAPVVASDAAAGPVKRGRGRPPKPKNPVADDSAPTEPSVVTADANAVPVKRGRGRPPKVKDPITVATDQATGGVLIPPGRGRPPKKVKFVVEDPSGEPAAAPGVAADANAVPVKRGRGRPPKLRPAVVGKVIGEDPAVVGKVIGEDPSGEPAAASGVAADANAPVKRGRLQPPKVRPSVEAV